MTPRALLLFLALPLACGGRGLPAGQGSRDGGSDSGAPADAGTTMSDDAADGAPADTTALLEHPDADASGPGADVGDAADVRDAAPGTDATVPPDAATDAASDADGSLDAGPSFPCNLDCPAGPCALRAGASPVVVATGPKGERLASLAVAADALYFGTISPDIFARGRLSKVPFATGEASVLDPHVQASWIGLGPTSVFYVGDAVQARAGDLWSLPRSGGTRRGWASSDSGFGGVVIVSEETVIYEQGYGATGIIWQVTEEASGMGSSFGRVVDVMGAPRGFAVDATSVAFAAGTSPSTIRLAPLDQFDTSSSIRLLLTSDDPVGHLVLSGPDVYFLHESAAGACKGSVAAVSKAGGAPRLVSLGRSGSDASSLAVDGGFVYWSTFDQGGQVFRAATGGGTPELLASRQRSASHVVVDATRVYWTVEDADGDQVRAVAK